MKRSECSFTSAMSYGRIQLNLKLRSLFPLYRPQISLSPFSPASPSPSPTFTSLSPLSASTSSLPSSLTIPLIPSAALVFSPSSMFFSLFFSSSSSSSSSSSILSTSASSPFLSASICSFPVPVCFCLPSLLFASFIFPVLRLILYSLLSPLTLQPSPCPPPLPPPPLLLLCLHYHPLSPPLFPAPSLLLPPYPLLPLLNLLIPFSSSTSSFSSSASANSFSASPYCSPFASFTLFFSCAVSFSPSPNLPSISPSPLPTVPSAPPHHLLTFAFSFNLLCLLLSFSTSSFCSSSFSSPLLSSLLSFSYSSSVASPFPPVSTQSPPVFSSNSVEEKWLMRRSDIH